MEPQVIARYMSLGEAGAARSAVSAAGILATLHDDGMIGVNWTNCNAVGWIKLVVPAEHADEATGIIATNAEAAPEDAAPEVAEPAPDLATDDDSLCPECRSANVAFMPKLRIFGFFALAAIGLGAVTGQRDLAAALIAAVGLITLIVPRARCRDCGEQWTPAGPHAEEPDAPPPDGEDLLEPHCPRCFSTDIYRIAHRRLKGATMLVQLLLVLPLPLVIWPLLPKQKCESCGLTLWTSADISRSEEQVAASPPPGSVSGP